MKYQIKFPDGQGGCTYRYFDAASRKEARERACTAADDFLRVQRAQETPFHKIRPPKTVRVVEWDDESKWTKRNGDRFRLKLYFVQTRFLGGWTERVEWYEVKDESKAVPAA